MSKNLVRENVPLSRFGVLVAQLESIGASASQQFPDPLLSFDLLSDLLSAIDEEPHRFYLVMAKKMRGCIVFIAQAWLAAASVAMAKIISRGDSISIYSRASSLQGFLSDAKRSEPQRVAGRHWHRLMFESERSRLGLVAAFRLWAVLSRDAEGSPRHSRQGEAPMPLLASGAVRCLGELYQHFGRKITSGLPETTIIASKLMKFHEDFVRQEALLMLEKALEGSGGSAASTAYTEAFRLITRIAIGDKSFVFASIGGPCLGVGEIENSASYCVKAGLLPALEDPVLLVRDAFSEALGSLLALGMNPEAQVQPRGKGPFPPAKKLEGGLQRHLALPFTKVSGTRLKDVRIGITLSWVYFLQAIRLKYLHPDSELQQYALQVMEMLRPDTSVDAHALELKDSVSYASCPCFMEEKACILYILRVGVTDLMTEPTQRGFLVFLGKQIPLEFKELFDSTIVAAVSHSSQLVRIEAALALRVFAEVDPTCVGGLILYVVTTLSASRDNVSFEKGSKTEIELDSLNGQTTVWLLGSIMPLGYPASNRKSIATGCLNMLLTLILADMMYNIGTSLLRSNSTIFNDITKISAGTSESSRNPVAAIVEKEAGWLLLSSLLSSMPKQELEDQVFDILSLWATLFSGNPEREIQKIEDLASRIWDAARCEESSCLRLLLDKRDAWLGPWIPGRASSEGLGLLARLGNDIFTAKMTRLLLGDLPGATDFNYAGSIAFALGCIHRSAGGMALSSLVPQTVSSISLLAKSTITGLQIWSLYGLLLTIEASGFSYVTHVQATLELALGILLSEENGLVDFQQGVGHLINAIVAVLGPELAPGSIFFSRCKSVIGEISSWQETATLLESVRFTQQLVLFAPQAVSVHTHVQTLLSTLSSGQPTLRHLAVSTLRHLIEKDPVSISDEQIEDSLFHMLNEETDSVIGSLVPATIMRLLLASCPSCPSHWILICRNMVLATLGRQDTDTNRSAGNDPSNGPDNDSGMDLGEDDENMVSGSKGMPMQGSAFAAEYDLAYLASLPFMFPCPICAKKAATFIGLKRCFNKNQFVLGQANIATFNSKEFTVWAAQCLSSSVGKNPAHFDLSLARKQYTNGGHSRDWLVLHVQELISLAYQISKMSVENMRPIGVGLLTAILDKVVDVRSYCGDIQFEKSPDPELPGHLLLEQYQYQLVSAVRTALDASSGPILLEAGLQLATKIMTSGVWGGDQVAVKRIFSLISRPLNDLKDVYYPSFAEWVSCKIKIRLLAAHASLKCYTFSFLRRHHEWVPDEYLRMLPLFSKSSSILRKYWIGVLKDYSYICLCLDAKKNWNPFLDGIQSPLVSSKVQLSLEESWPVILQALALDAIPVNTHGDSKATDENTSNNSLISGYSMVELDSAEVRYSGDSPTEETSTAALKQYEIVLPVFQFLLTERFFTEEYITMDICRELLQGFYLFVTLEVTAFISSISMAMPCMFKPSYHAESMQVFFYSIYMDNSWNTLSISVLSQIVQNCPADFLEAVRLSGHGTSLGLYLQCFSELILSNLLVLRIDEALSDHLHCEELISPLFIAAKILVKRCEPKKQLKSVVVALVLVGYKCIREAMTELSFSTANDFVKCTTPLMKNLIDGERLDSAGQGNNGSHLRAILGTCLNVIADLIKDCIKGIHLLENKRPDLLKLLQLKLSFSIEQMVLFAKLVYESQYCRQTEDSNTICLAVLKYCTKYIQTVLNDSNVQVQAIGLQALKTMTQRSANIEDISFFIFFSGELITEIFHIIHNSLKKPVSKESVAIAGECLRFLVLLQTLSKANECQRGFMNLLLKAIVMIFSASEDDSSQEVSDIRTNAVRLVSSLCSNSFISIPFLQSATLTFSSSVWQLQKLPEPDVAWTTSYCLYQKTELECHLHVGEW
uniref:Uncharacterized protein n=1 Tax=Salix viminalis TaxID=40686 RepID=A0A6N2MN55_SALVM